MLIHATCLKWFGEFLRVQFMDSLRKLMLFVSSPYSCNSIPTWGCCEGAGVADPTHLLEWMGCWILQLPKAELRKKILKASFPQLLCGREKFQEILIFTGKGTKIRDLGTVLWKKRRYRYKPAWEENTKSREQSCKVLDEAVHMCFSSSICLRSKL